jgi:hypothetical protein
MLGQPCCVVRHTARVYCQGDHTHRVLCTQGSMRHGMWPVEQVVVR